MKEPRHYTALNPPPKVKVGDLGKSRTRQSDAETSDINKIMKKYEKVGVIPVLMRQGFFADVSEVADYRTALDQVNMAQDYFMSLPADLRARFGNDAATFIDFTSNPENRSELVELGLIPAEESPEASSGEAPPATLGAGDTPVEGSGGEQA